MNKCLNCHKELKEGRRGNWYYYCNKKCMNEAIENFKSAITELCKGKHVCVVTIKSKEK